MQKSDYGRRVLPIRFALEFMFEFMGIGRMFELAFMFMFIFVAIGVLVAIGVGDDMFMFMFMFMLLLLTVLFAAPPHAIPRAPSATTAVSAIFFIILYRSPVFFKVAK